MLAASPLELPGHGIDAGAELAIPRRPIGVERRAHCAALDTVPRERALDPDEAAAERRAVEQASFE